MLSVVSTQQGEYETLMPKTRWRACCWQPLYVQHAFVPALL